MSPARLSHQLGQVEIREKCRADPRKLPACEPGGEEEGPRDGPGTSYQRGERPGVSWKFQFRCDLVGV